MTQFCRNFCFACPACQAAIAEIKAEELIFADLGPNDAAIPTRTELEKAALDCHGQP